MNALIASEMYDLGIVPFNRYFPLIRLYNFYDFDQGPVDEEKNLSLFLRRTDYIVIPSQRIYSSRLVDNKDFPRSSEFYSNLFSGKLGYRKIYQSSCDAFCQLVFPSINFLQTEQTAQVFDRPTVIIFKNHELDK
jgi:hypothetical protein